jgi:hypothetical protein
MGNIFIHKNFFYPREKIIFLRGKWFIQEIIFLSLDEKYFPGELIFALF